MRVLLCLCLCLVGCGWTRSEVAAETVALAATAADWYQTRVIVAGCDEVNPIIGPCGERLTPDAYFPLALVAQLAVAAVLPHPWRLAWAGATAGAEVNQVYLNTLSPDPALAESSMSQVLYTRPSVWRLP